ncbi:Fat-like cadherin-related tumor suppressor-like protein, partial [Gonioctena quinquepunctata]
NPPFCTKHRYYHTLSEGILPGSSILSIQVTDLDGPEFSRPRYSLTGRGSEDFNLNENGHLKTATYLDREKQSKYSLTSHVHDREHVSWKCSSEVEIIITDLNDNAPIFTLPYYSVSLNEDVEVGTLVTTIHATDADTEINKKIQYSFIDTFNNHFQVSSDTGIVTLTKPLDREIKSKYNLTIQAMDYGTPRLSSNTYLIVNVQDINDNPPEFEKSHYFSIIPEIDAVGTEIVRILATSKDIGANAEVHYSIIGGNEHKKFSMDNKTGVITVADTLDYERAKDYFLTIQAIDGGIPPLSNVATINISISDCNDNAPVFSQQSYNAKIREDAQIGDKILQIIATDLDSDKNGEVRYSLLKGNTHNNFQIDEKTGYVSVAAELDREKISSYVIEILAKDSGLPVLSQQSLLNIEISDANDNPPLFAMTNYTAIIQEDKPIGYSVVNFEITDQDTFPNTVPYTFDFRNGNEGNSFRLDQDGILRTATKFNHKIRDTYLLQIRVFDNGIPPLYSDTWVIIRIIEESQYPPIITPLEVTINSYMEDYPGGIIGKVFANDQDRYDILTFSISPTIDSPYSMQDLFQVNQTDGTLTALPKLDIGIYRLNVTVTDGKFLTHTIVKISVEIVSDDMLENSVALRFHDVKPETFILSHRKGFVKAIRSTMNCRSEDVIIISVHSSGHDPFKLQHYLSNNLDVLFTVRKPDKRLFSSDTIRKALTGKLNELEESTKLMLEEIIRSKCSNKYCLHGVCQDHYMLDNNIIDPVFTDVTSFVSPRHHSIMECICKEGYGGEKCDIIINECARDPCSPFKLCIPDSSQVGYSCQCPEGYAGLNCDVDISKCHDQNCYISRNPIYFSGKSYSQYRIINKKAIEDQLSLSLRIRTVQPTGNLMYAAGKVDYNILEVVNGGIQYRYDLGSGEGIVRVSDFYVSDGKWHEIKLERERNNAKIIIDSTYSAQGSAPGVSEILNLQNEEMYLGAEVHQHPSILGFEDVQRGFSGCMDDIKISRVSVPLHKSEENMAVILKRFANVEFSCDISTTLTPPGPCGSQPCMNGGTCKETKNGYECDCHERYKGTLCEHDSDPCASAPCLYGDSVEKDVNMVDIVHLILASMEVSVKKEMMDHYANADHLLGNFVNMTSMSVIPHPVKMVVHVQMNLVLFGVFALRMLQELIVQARCYFSQKRKRNKPNQNLKDNIVLNSTRPQEPCDYKRGSKLSNLEVNQREIPICAPRPVSYAANAQNEGVFNCNAAHVMLNNLDTLRSYGSAGDELENVPPDYVRNLNRNMPQGILSNNCDSDKTTWAEQMHLASSLTDKSRIKNDFKIPSTVNCDTNRSYYNRSNNANIKTNGLVCGDEEQRSNESYHWDCSDWVRHSQTLPNITEVPGSEVPDSSSFHSNESNESRCNMYSTVLCAQDPQRHIATLNEDIETENAADTERDMSPDVPCLNPLNGGNDEYGFTPADLYIRHPNSYLPLHGYNITNEIEAESLQSPGAESDDVEPYGFPINRNRRKNCDDDITSVITTLEERHSLLGGYVSNSDLSTNLCEIEDSECETEHKPINSYINIVQQTSV